MKFKIDAELRYAAPILDKKIYEVLKNGIKADGVENSLIVTSDGIIVWNYIDYNIAKELEIPDEDIPYKIKDFGCRMEMLRYVMRRGGQYIVGWNLFRKCIYLDQMMYVADIIIKLNEEKISNKEMYRYFTKEGILQNTIPNNIQECLDKRCSIDYKLWCTWQTLTKEECFVSEFNSIVQSCRKRKGKIIRKDGEAILIFLNKELETEDLLKRFKKEIGKSIDNVVKYYIKPNLLLLNQQEIQIKGLQNQKRIDDIINYIIEQKPIQTTSTKPTKKPKRKRVKIQSANIEEFLDW